MIKYPLIKIQSPWYEIPVDLVKQLFEDERYIGEICHLFNESENAETLIQSDEELGDAIFEALENHSPFAVHVNDVYAHSELFEIREVESND